MISIKTQEEIELMRQSGKITYGVLSSLKDFIKSTTIDNFELKKLILDKINLLNYEEK